MGYWKKDRVRQRGLMQRVPTSAAVYSTDSAEHTGSAAAIGKAETVKPKAEYRRPRTLAERTDASHGSTWRTVPPAHKLPSKKAGSKLTRRSHRAGKLRSMTLPDYRTDDGNDALRASIAADLLALIV